MDFDFFAFCEDNGLDATTDEAAEAWDNERCAREDDSVYSASYAD